MKTVLYVVCIACTLSAIVATVAGRTDAATNLLAWAILNATVAGAP